MQTVLAGGLVLLGVLAERYFGFHLGPRQWAGMILAAAGLAVLAGAGEARSGQESAEYSLAGMLAVDAALAGIAAALIILCGRRGVMLGIAAGLLFAVSHVAVKALTGRADVGMRDVALSPYLPLAAAAGAVAFFASARSLQLGPGVPVIALTSIAGNAATIPAGLVVFGDPLGGDPLTIALRSAAFACVVVAGGLIPAPRVADPPAPQTGSLSSERQRYRLASVR